MAVAMLREGYTTTVRPFRDSDETATIKWYRCPEGAKELPFPSLFRSLHWQSHPYTLARSKGEVFNAPVTVFPHLPIAGATGQAPCGTEEDFAKGGAYLPDEPPYERAASGLAVCCGATDDGLLVGGGHTSDGAGALNIDGGSLDRRIAIPGTCVNVPAGWLWQLGVRYSWVFQTVTAGWNEAQTPILPAGTYRLTWSNPTPNTNKSMVWVSITDCSTFTDFQILTAGGGSSDMVFPGGTHSYLRVNAFMFPTPGPSWGWFQLDTVP